jgi:exopolysaccharide biosynthesis protein
MSASTRTVQGTLGTRRLGTALAVIALVIAFAVALAVSQTLATKSQAAPAARSVPAFIDRGSRDEIGPGAAISAAPVYNDYSWPGYTEAAAAAAAKAAGKAPVYNDHGLHSRLLRGSKSTSAGGSRLLPQ